MEEQDCLNSELTDAQRRGASRTDYLRVAMPSVPKATCGARTTNGNQENACAFPTSVGSANTEAWIGTDFKTADGLRALLVRLYGTGPGGWQYDLEVAKLMDFAVEKYKPLAGKYHLDPWEIASAAFEVMLSRAAREAENPWAVVTHAVRITCMSENRAQGLLCSVQTARHHLRSSLQDVQRFSQSRTPMGHQRPLFTSSGLNTSRPEEPRASSAHILVDAMLEQTTALLILLGWPPDSSRLGIEFVCAELIRVGNRKSAYESLRRDKQVRALLDLEHHTWVVLLRTLLGDPRPAYSATKCGRGVLLRLLLGETLESLLNDTRLVESLVPSGARRGRDCRMDRDMHDGGA